MKRWPQPNPYFWETAPFFRLLLPLAAGITLYYSATVALHGYIVPAIVIALGVSLVLVQLLYRPQGKVLFSLLLHSCFFVLGYSIAWSGDVVNTRHWFGHQLHNAQACKAVVTSLPQEKENSWKLSVNVIEVATVNKVVATNGLGFVYLSKDMPMLYHQGDTIMLPAAWAPIKNAGNPYEFDYAGYCRRNNTWYQQYCKPQQVRLYAKLDSRFRPTLDKWHLYAANALRNYLPEKRVRGLLQAMLLGDEADLDPDLRNIFSNTGIVHVIAISGGNVMMFFIVIAFLLRWIRHSKYKWISYVAALPLVWIYVVMAGASPSAVRAAIMFSFLAFGFVLNKNNNPLNQLLGTAFVLLCARPQWLLAVGFQLSFLAVLSLILFYNPLNQLYVPASKYKLWLWIKRNCWNVVCASLAAEILVAPLVIYYFHNFPLWFLVANVLAWVFMFIVLVGGMAIVALAAVPKVATGIAFLVGLTVHALEVMLLAMQQFSPRSLQYLSFSGLQTLLVYCVIAGIAAMILLRYKRAVFIALPATALLMVLLVTDKWRSMQQTQLVIYNAGKQAHIEQVIGNRYIVFYSDAAPGKVKYVRDPVHIQLQAWQPIVSSGNSIAFVHNGKRVIVVDAPVYAGDFPVSYVVVTTSEKQDISILKKIYHPESIILAGNCSRKEQQRLRAEAKAAGVALHITGVDGAFSPGM